MFTPEQQVHDTHYSPPAAPRKLQARKKSRITNKTHPTTLDFNKKIDYDVLCMTVAIGAVAFLWIIVLLYP